MLENVVYCYYYYKSYIVINIFIINNNNNNNKSYVERRNYVYIFYCAARARCNSAAQCYII